MNLNGNWYLPTNEEKKIPGILKIESGQFPFLEIHGTWYTSQSEPTEFEEIICGYAENGKKITLINSYLNNHSVSGGYTKISFSAEAAIIGENFRNREDIKISAIKLSHNFLLDWLNLKPFRNLIDESKKQFRMEYINPNDIEIEISDSLKFQIKFEFQYPAIYQTNTQSFKNSGYIVIVFKQDSNFSDLSLNLFKIQQFFSIVLFRNLSNFNINLKFNKQNSLWCDYLNYKNRNENIDSTSNTSRSFRYLINYQEIEQDLPLILKNWFLHFETLKPMISALFVYMYMTETTIELRFLTIVQALESFHRRTQENEKNKETFISKLSSICEKISESEAEWLKNKLRYGFEPNLQKRLEFIFEEIKLLGLENFFVKPKKSIRKIIDTRNYLTHFEQSSEHKILNHTEMVYYTDRLALVLVFLLLKKCEISEIALANLIQRLIKSNFIGFL
ncbi:hypothetical protein ND861_18690 [Leptospira sp. 2 VSF19]|uniref:ApeA N-terminal domain-containing protein n=1 Tax=Leptospira soteropolitanensis TaxID=2950025 RepID=A0AAW5VIB9_9LEPT|nr:HEPN domain-containing protein [Leptospira soteropolitanensis]MCW7494687.1 hypothetical protein [Leptospira soteropolitanensis]MCW7502298.1 hypothetical protein [Leptospira soteropolitanensis]MCW7524516.1 hypothetical protein [Leptospira soteropolitanensis]MCW7528392.1 hypothetical protein [Leptospira soteropolitanensis]MCW7532250.1 hypothetical protein [Leptospira soteropolitanensis]